MAESSAAAVRAGISRCAEHPFLLDVTGEPLRVARDARLPADMPLLERLIAMGASVLAELAHKLGASISPLGPTWLLLALPESRPGFSDQDAEQVGTSLRARAPFPINIQLTAKGHAGALAGMAQAAAAIAAGQLELCLVVGIESYLDLYTLDWLQSHRQLATSDSRGGFTPGEAAGTVALASGSLARQLRMPAHAVLRQAATATEATLIRSDAECFGEGLAMALARASGQESVDAVICDINGERYRSQEWAMALLRHPGLIRDTAYSAPADCWGDVGAASGALFCVLACRAWARYYSRGPRTLLFAGSEHGLRAAAVLQQPEMG
jgi:3-oxoacyl-[acyl-carrier-protein] synthase-1